MLSPVDYPVWKYTGDIQLEGFRDVLDAQRPLYENGLLHRDISAGNIILLSDNAVKTRGVSVDFDVAYSPNCDLHNTFFFAERNLCRRHVSDLLIVKGPEDAGQLQDKPVRRYLSDGSLRCLPMTGTAQFMTIDLLEAIQKKRPIVLAPYHDVESLVYALAYTILRHNIEDTRTPPVVKTRLLCVFDKAFGQTSVDTVLVSRQTVYEDSHPVGWIAYLAGEMMKRQEMLERGAMLVDDEGVTTDQWLMESIGQPMMRLFLGLAIPWRDRCETMEVLLEKMSDFPGLKRRREQLMRASDDKCHITPFRTSPIITQDTLWALLDESIADASVPT